MKLALPITWFVFAALCAISPFLLMIMAPYGDTATSLMLLVPTAISGTLIAISLGLTYLFILRTRPSPAVAVFGLLHVLLALLAGGLQFCGHLMRQQVMLSQIDVSSAASRMGLFYGGASIAGYLAWACLITALIIAINTRPPASETF